MAGVGGEVRMPFLTTQGARLSPCCRPLGRAAQRQGQAQDVSSWESPVPLLLGDQVPNHLGQRTTYPCSGEGNSGEWDTVLPF